MTRASEAFVTTIGRIISSHPRSRAALRGLSAADRDDAAAAAMLECWERRATFTNEGAEQFVYNALRRAVRYIKSAQRVGNYAELKLMELRSVDDTALEAAARSAVERMTLTKVERGVAMSIAEGYSSLEIAERQEIAISEVARVRRKLRKFKDMMPTADIDKTFQRRDADEDTRPLASIDHEIEQLLRRPAHTTADCPVCWRCMYFEGFTPKRYAPPALVDDEMRAVVEAIEARKIHIGQGERL